MNKKLKHISMLVLLAVAVQGTWAQTTFSLGRPLYRDGDWNTLCLPFDMNGDQINNSPLAGTVIKELVGTKSNLTNGVLTLKFTDAAAIKAGKPYIVKWPADVIIKTQEDWNSFADSVNQGKSTYEGKIVRLEADINVKTAKMVGNSSYSFMGKFDGGGHTINCEIDNSGDSGYQGTAPFSNIRNATIMNVKVTGSVKGANHCAGLVGFASGTNTIESCEVAAEVICTGSNCGGILGHGQYSTTTISNCLFSGSITSSTNSQVGIIYGWSDSGSGSHTIDHCLANGTYNVTGTLDMILGNGTKNANSCYKNTTSGSYGTNYKAADNANATSSSVIDQLGSNWKTVNSKAVPKMAAVIAGKTDAIKNPEFSGVTTDYNKLTEISFTGGTFKGNFTPLAINNGNRNEILLFAARNKLGYANTDRTLKAYSAYFEIPTSSGPRAVSSFVLDFDDDVATGITTTNFTDYTDSDAWYTLDGRKLVGKPTTKGIFINKGRKVVIK